MGFINHYRGHLPAYSGEFNESMLFEEVTLEDFLAERYPPLWVKEFPDQAQSDRDHERTEIQAAMMTEDRLWLWRRVDTSYRTDGSAWECGGLAVRRGRKVVQVWLVWDGD